MGKITPYILAVWFCYWLRYLLRVLTHSYEFYKGGITNVVCDDCDGFITQWKNIFWLFGPKVHEIIYVRKNPAPMSPYFPTALTGSWSKPSF